MDTSGTKPEAGPPCAIDESAAKSFGATNEADSLNTHITTNKTQQRPSPSTNAPAAEPSGETSRTEPDANDTQGEPVRKKRRQAELKKLCKQKKRKEHRENGVSIITNESALLDSNHAGRRIIKLDLFPEITKEINLKMEKKSQERSDESDKNLSKSTHQSLIPRARTEQENEDALKQVESDFSSCDHGCLKISTAIKQKCQIICVVKFMKLASLDQKHREDLDFICRFFHDCKQFISPTTTTTTTTITTMTTTPKTTTTTTTSTPSESQLPCDFDVVTSAIGWSQDTTRLEILHQYRNEQAIKTNQELYDKLVVDSERAGSILWEQFSTLGNVAADKTRKHMKELGSKGLISNLKFPSDNLYDNHDRLGIDLEPPLSFAIVIPTFKSTGKIALESEGYRVDNGQFVFPDIKQAIKFPPDTVSVLIFRAQQYAHGTLKSTQFGDSSRLSICIQPPIQLDKPSDISPSGEEKPGN
ncbi:hypothetical protein MJO28_005420 [Puccinia striiformis f. sp. tritici]|uniref:Uncharacterized protein n=1 Tax=Puccinia striiformis f. sp. tritici TaxID=168172 RepID=A0ACC0EL59_9BASI|nr:hypothetical protein MJO28_005420 [Puccinia striiformis f. sp. tritici]